SGPLITLNPSSQTICPGSVSFTAAASGTPAPSVQWQVSTDGGLTFTDVAGASSTTYTFTAVAADDGKRYRARFSNACTSNVATTAATLTLNSGPLITLRSAERRIGQGRGSWRAQDS